MGRKSGQNVLSAFATRHLFTNSLTFIEERQRIYPTKEVRNGVAREEGKRKRPEKMYECSEGDMEMTGVTVEEADDLLCSSLKERLQDTEEECFDCLHKNNKINFINFTFDLSRK